MVDASHRSGVRLIGGAGADANGIYTVAAPLLCDVICFIFLVAVDDWAYLAQCPAVRRKESVKVPSDPVRKVSTNGPTATPPS